MKTSVQIRRKFKISLGFGSMMIITDYQDRYVWVALTVAQAILMYAPVLLQKRLIGTVESWTVQPCIIWTTERHAESKV